MKNKKLILVLVILLVIGFASISTTLVLNGVIGVGANKDDFNVIFTEALLDGESANVTIDDNKKNISFTTRKLTTIGDSTVLNYKVKNTSTQYDANVIINCTNNAEEYIKLTSSFDNKDIPLVEPVKMIAQEVKSGYINAELIKPYVGEDKSIEVSCSLVVNAESKEGYSYTVNFDSDGGSNVEDKIVDYQGSYGELPVPEKEGYVFLGWYDENDQKIESASVIDAKGNKTLHAKWTPVCPYEVGKTWDFNYTGGEQTFKVPCDGEYKLETWGAQGGSYNSTYYGGYGAYSSGTIAFNDQENVFINVGKSGGIRRNNYDNINISGGYNGGGDAMGSWTYVVSSSYKIYNISGGGATSISLKSGLLENLERDKNKVIIVSAGGGGAQYFIKDSFYSIFVGGHGGGITGSISNCTDSNGLIYLTINNTATQDKGAETIYTGDIRNGSFGKGASGYSGGGGGLYGGAGNYCVSGGGSSYIGNQLLKNKGMYCYNCEESSEESTKTTSTTCASSNPTASCAKQGDGYAKITLLSVTY